MILENGKILTSGELLEKFKSLGLPLPIDLNDPKQKEKLDAILANMRPVKE